MLDVEIHETPESCTSCFRCFRPGARFRTTEAVGTLQGVSNNRNDDVRFDLRGSRANSSRANGPTGRTPDTELWDRIWRQALGLAVLLAVMIGGACLVMLVIGTFADPSRYSVAALVVAGIGVPLTVATGILAVRARRNRSWPWLLGALAVELAWAAVLALTVRA
ncbi:hypothetical protein ABZW18_20340 [Streptomyces sp. NPDC004647]|uniref:hypothetical protein n=1 Tax=Streptomyces sp. NPDC004647 TaxID=3154671 RepID=UPI0033AE715E